MFLRFSLLALAAVVAATLPGAAAERSVRLHGVSYQIALPTGYAFSQRMGKAGDGFEAVLFRQDRMTVAISTTRIAADAATESADDYQARLAESGASNIIRQDGVSRDGQATVRLSGACDLRDGTYGCIYVVERPVDAGHAITTLVDCNSCSSADARVAGALAQGLFRQLQKL